MMTSIGDLAMSFSNRLTNARIRSDLNTLAQELSSGRKSDLRSALAGDVAPVSVLERSLSNLAAYGTANDEASLFAETAQTALEQVGGHLDALAGAALAMDNTTDELQIANFAANAASRFEAVVGALNTSVAGRSLFGGAETASPPLAPAREMLDALAAALPPVATVQEISDTVDAWFAPGGAFDTTGYRGATVPLAPFRMRPGEAVSFGMDARATEIRAALAATAKAALLDRGVLDGRPVEASALIGAIAEDLLGASNRITALRGDVGVLEERIDAARTRNASEGASARIALSTLVAADPYDTATNLQAVQTQLETFFSVTARLSQLTLSGYLR
ncbi:flagellin [Oceaniglobus roseus]|uniref:flagellin N-terminal helical domain-containing protein n=1 Tax=Oceaniglobus roseus TaxID=1737570 RepID=UPI000C7EAF5B|nr:flagellin [Kandeliimicrobium roseum]